MRSLARLSRKGTGSARQGADRRSPRRQDWALSILVVVAHLAPVQSGQADSGPSPGWAEGAVPFLALGSGLPLVWRRAHPRAVAACVLGCYAGIAVAQGMVPPYAAWVLVWSLATRGSDRRRAIALASAAAATTSALLVGAELTRPGVGAVALLVAVTILVLLAAVLVRSERSRVEAVGLRAATEERLRIARDLHDLVGHGLGTIAVQSSSARLALDAGDRDAASRALSAVEGSSRVAMREMRQMLGVLVDVDSEEARSSPVASTAGRPPSPGIDDIPSLISNIRAGGVAVVLERTGVWENASPDVQLVAYRVVQEGLTNAVKHAPGSLVTVRLAAADGTGRVAVKTARVSAAAGQAPRSRAPSGGLGLEGLRARVAAVSGEFASGPTDQGWLIEARLPLHVEEDP